LADALEERAFLLFAFAPDELELDLLAVPFGPVLAGALDAPFLFWKALCLPCILFFSFFFFFYFNSLRKRMMFLF
jgi:hypothetical protein